MTATDTLSELNLGAEMFHSRRRFDVFETMRQASRHPATEGERGQPEIARKRRHLTQGERRLAEARRRFAVEAKEAFEGSSGEGETSPIVRSRALSKIVSGIISSLHDGNMKMMTGANHSAFSPVTDIDKIVKLTYNDTEARVSVTMRKEKE